MVCGILVSSMFYSIQNCSLTVPRDVQIRLGFRCHNFINLGGICLVHYPDDFMEVSSLAVRLSLPHATAEPSSVEMQIRQITKLQLSAWIH